jgi:hypothetical protein
VNGESEHAREALSSAGYLMSWMRRSDRIRGRWIEGQLHRSGSDIRKYVYLWQKIIIPREG